MKYRNQLYRMHCNYILVCLLATQLIVRSGSALSGEEAVKRFFAYFKVDEPKGIPVIAFEEPMDLFSPLEMVPITMENGTLLGHSNLTFDQIFIDLMLLKVEIKFHGPRLEIEGSYTWPGIFSSSVGNMNATITQVEIISNMSMFINENDTLQIDDVQFIMDNEEVFLNMTELLWEHELLLATGSVHIFFSDIVQESFRQLKPMILYETNKELSNFISNLPPVMKKQTTGAGPRPALRYFLQRIMTYLGLDPLKLPTKSSKLLGVNFKVSNLVLHGISVINDIKSLFLFYHDQEIYLESEMVYPKLLLYYTLGLSTGRFMHFDKYEKLQLNNVKIRLKLVIDPSTRKPPIIKDFHVNVESFGKLRTGRRKGFFEFVGSLFLDVADDIRNQIISALTGPIKNMIQNELNNMDLEDAILHLVEKKTG